MDNLYFTTEKKGYNKSEVDSFILKINESQKFDIQQKDDAIKTLSTELENSKAKLAESQEQVNLLKQEIEKIKQQSEAKENDLNLRMGEKISAAEEAAKKLLEQAETSCKEMKQKAEQEIYEHTAKAKEKIDKYSEKACKIADIYEEKQHLVTAGIEQARRHLSEASENIFSILNGKENE
ncbi:hypothetical protein LJB90_02640 [Eubacteriales bacterium OttesenSCG-928-G02]|nr:hypothetical protein [Eubacteriales bacterium OttesenSCG-928-G02]